MPTIHILPKSIAELIAAGEVVDRPASIVKELVENALDAGSTRIAVELQRGGITYLRVTDNGCGIAGEQIETAFIRHATSKVATVEDLNAIGTLGFRGEALPSIAAVSHVNLITRTEASPVGWRYSIHGDTAVKEEIGCAVGTTVEVRDLFYNTPARMKFLKKDVTEGNAIATLLERLALANPHVAFSLLREGQIRMKTSGDGKLLAAVRAVCGGELAASLFPIPTRAGDIAVSGLISKPGNGRSTRAMQMFFVNSRYVRSKTCESAVEEAYKNRLMSGRFPACVLNVTLAADRVDVNVHPTKLEIRFESEREVYNAVYSACVEALSQSEQKAVTVRRISPFSLSDFDYRGKQVALTSALPVPAEKRPIASQLPQTNATTASVIPMKTFSMPLALHDDTGKIAMPRFKPDIAVEEETDQSKISVNVNRFTEAEFPCKQARPPIEPTTKEAAPVPLSTKSWRVVGEVFSSYILVEQRGNLLLIDKHAAHERYLYEQIKSLSDTKDSPRQVLLTPQAVTLPKEDYYALTEQPEALEALGMTAEDFGEGTLLIREIPMVFEGCSLSGLLSETAGRLLKQKTNLTPNALDELLYSVCCRAAVMAGKPSNPQELNRLAAMVLEEQIRFCPHGRPAVLTLTQREIEKMFGRLG